MADLWMRRSVLLLMALAMTLVWACRREPPANEESTITVLYDADERLFGPYWSSDPWFLVFLPLVTNDESGHVAPRLAQTWEHSPDYRRWTFNLRSDVRWHDGVPTTAHDVKFTIEFQGRPDILYDDAWHDVDSIVVLDDTTLSIYYGRPKDALNDWIVYWPKHLLERLDPAEFWEWEFWVHPVGNGPYRYVRHVPKTMVELEANADFYAGKPAIDRVRIKFGGRETAVIELTSGNVDVLTWVDHSDLPTLASDDRFRIYQSRWPGIPWINVLAWNHRHQALSDARVRKALTMALDRSALLALLHFPTDFRIADVPYTPSQYISGEIAAPIAFDPDGARALLESAGWADADGDGIRERDRRSLAITVLVASDEDETVAVFAQAAFRRIGVDLEVQRLEASVVRARVLAGEFEAAVYRFWNATPGHIMWFGRVSDAQHDSGQFPDIGYRKAEIADLLEAAMDTVDSAARARIYQELAAILLEDVPITFLYPGTEAIVAHRRIKGFTSPYRSNPMKFLESLWIEQ